MPGSRLLNQGDDLAAEAIHVVRFGQERIRFRNRRQLLGLGAFIGGDDQHRQVGSSGVFPQAGQNIPPVHLGEPDVQHGGIERLRLGGFESSRTIHASHDFKPDPLQAQNQQSTGNGLIFNYENLAVVLFAFRHIRPSIGCDEIRGPAETPTLLYPSLTAGPDWLIPANPADAPASY